MAWCPKCKNEYRKGITVCADCGCELVEKEQLARPVPIVFGEEKQMLSLKKFLEYNDLDGVEVSFEKNQQAHVLLVNEADRENALKLSRVFMEQKAKEEVQRQMMENAGMEMSPTQEEPKEDTDGRVSVPAGAYINSAQKAEDNRSSAWTLLLIGGGGMLVMILGMTGVLPFNVSNPYMFYGVMSAVFLLFIVMGFVSVKSARFFAKNAESESTLKNTLLDWCKENLKAEEIDAGITYADEIAYEELCLRRFDIIKYRINHQFMNLDQGFVDRLVDDEVYDMVFSEK